MTVVEHIPLAFDTYDSAVVVAGGGQPIFGFAAVQSNIAVGDDYPAVSEIPVRVFAGGITQLMLGFRGIDEIVAIPYFANGTSFKKGMPFPLGTEALFLPRQDLHRFTCDREHIICQGNSVRP